MRYLKARDWNVNKAHQLLRGTLKWRQEYNTDSITAEEVMESGKPGHLYQRGFDKEGRAVIVMTPSRETRKENFALGIRYLVYTIENAIHSMQDQADQMVWLIDFSNFSKNHLPIRFVSCSSFY